MSWSLYSNALRADGGAGSDALDANPRIKRWVSELVAQRDRLAAAIDAPVGMLLGCGHWGCVFASTPPWVVKLTIDPNEGPMWARIVQLLEKGRGQGGITRVKRLVRLEPGVVWGNRRHKTYVVVREDAEPVFELGPHRSILFTRRTKRELRLPELGHYQRPGPWDAVSTSPRDWFSGTIEGLIEYRAGVVRGDTKFAERVAAQIPGALGESLHMLATNKVFLRDLHLMNIGWRVYSRAPGFDDEDLTMCIFDPGHTRTDRTIPIGVTKSPLAPNPWGMWQR